VFDDAHRAALGDGSWRKIAISNNVGNVKPLFEHTTACTRRRAPFRSRGWFALSNLGSLLIVRVKNSVRPRLFIHCDVKLFIHAENFLESLKSEVAEFRSTLNIEGV